MLPGVIASRLGLHTCAYVEMSLKTLERLNADLPGGSVVPLVPTMAV